MLISNRDIRANVGVLLASGGFKGFVCIDRIARPEPLTDAWSLQSERAVEVGACSSLAVAMELLIEHHNQTERTGSERIHIPPRLGQEANLDSTLIDSPELSYRDCASLVLRLDDRSLTRRVVAVLGEERINSRLKILGLTNTRLSLNSDSELGTTTARDTVQLLRRIWAGDSVYGSAFNDLRRRMETFRPGGFSARLFPDSVRVGSVGNYSGATTASELGVVEYSGQRSYAVALFAMARSGRLNGHQAMKDMTYAAAQAMSRVMSEEGWSYVGPEQYGRSTDG